jgi:hypothetical protein
MHAQASPGHHAQTPPTLPRITTPAEARKLAEELIEAMKNLLGIIERETELVRAGNVRDATALEPEKNESSGRYTRIVSTLRNNAAYFKQAAPDLLATLHRHHDIFRAMLKVNLTVLATAHAVTEGIVRGVSGEVQRQRMPQGYTARGQRAAPSPRQAAPLAFNRAL